MSDEIERRLRRIGWHIRWLVAVVLFATIGLLVLFGVHHPPVG